MAVEFVTSALVSSCDKLGQICIASSVVWGIAVLLVLGAIKGLIVFFGTKPAPIDWQAGGGRESAPKGFKWVLVSEKELRN